MIAEVREIFTLFDKDADGYVSTSDLGTMIRGLNINPSQKEVENMIRDVDPNSTGTFNQNALLSLIARRPKKENSLEELIEALKILANSGSTEDNKETSKIETESLKSALTTSGKATGDDLREDEIDLIIKDCNLEHDDFIMIEDLARYLNGR